MQPVRVLIADSSARLRQTLCEVLSADPAITVAGTANAEGVIRDKLMQKAPTAHRLAPEGGPGDASFCSDGT